MMKRFSGRGAIAALMLGLGAVQGCYSYAPIDSLGPVQAGRYVELGITDRGRVGLGERFGAGVRKINGILLSQEGENVVLSIDVITNIDGEANRWAGDTTRIDRNFIGTMMQRRLSAPKTTLLAAGVAAVIYVTAASNLIGGGTDKDDEPTGPINQSNRVPPRPHSSRDIQVRLWRIYLP